MSLAKRIFAPKTAMLFRHLASNDVEESIGASDRMVSAPDGL